MRPADIVKESRLGARPCLFSGTVNSSDFFQVRPFMKLTSKFANYVGQQFPQVTLFSK